MTSVPLLILPTFFALLNVSSRSYFVNHIFSMASLSIFCANAYEQMCTFSLFCKFQARTSDYFAGILTFFNLRAKRGGSLFEAGSEREEHGGVTSVQNGV